MKKTLTTALCVAAILSAGCATVPKSDLAALQGTWKGQVVQDSPSHPCQITIAGSKFDFRDADGNVWYKGSFSLKEDTTPKQYIAVISDCPFPQYVGKTSMAIYRLENGMLTIAGNEPGLPEAPAAFDAPGAARMELKRQ